MVVAVDGDLIESQQLVQRGATRNPDKMFDVVFIVWRGHGVADKRDRAAASLPLKLGGNVLPERPAPGNIEQLDSPADAKRRNILPVAPFENHHLQAVPSVTERFIFRNRFFSIKSRIDIMAAGEEITINHTADMGKALLIQIGREHERDGTRFLKALKIARNHPEAVFFIIIQRHHSDHRSLHQTFLPFHSRECPAFSIKFSERTLWAGSV